MEENRHQRTLYDSKTGDDFQKLIEVRVVVTLRAGEGCYFDWEVNSAGMEMVYTWILMVAIQIYTMGNIYEAVHLG